MNKINGVRLFAVVKGIKEQKVKHYSGLPPELSSRTDSQTKLPNADIVIITPKPDGVFLYRFTRGGEFAGDTWHQTIDDAKKQAVFEFGDSLGVWKEIPKNVQDELEYIKKIGHD